MWLQLVIHSVADLYSGTELLIRHVCFFVAQRIKITNIFTASNCC